jgi:hypothetical protein
MGVVDCLAQPGDLLKHSLNRNPPLGNRRLGIRELAQAKRLRLVRLRRSITTDHARVRVDVPDDERSRLEIIGSLGLQLRLSVHAPVIVERGNCLNRGRRTTSPPAPGSTESWLPYSMILLARQHSDNRGIHRPDYSLQFTASINDPSARISKADVPAKALKHEWVACP